MLPKERGGDRRREQARANPDGWAATPPGLGKGWLVDLWGSSASALWAVGCSDRDPVAGSFGSGIIYHSDGTAWSPVVSPVITGSTPALFAIWGASATDIWAVGEDGTILRLT